MADKPPTALTNMEFDEVSLVTTPANQHAEITLSKSADEAFSIFEGMFSKSSPSSSSVHMDTTCSCGGDGCKKCGVKKSFAEKVKDFFYAEEVEKFQKKPPPGIGFPQQQQEPQQGAPAPAPAPQAAPAGMPQQGAPQMPQPQAPPPAGFPAQNPTGTMPQGAMPPTNAQQMPVQQQTQSGPPLPQEVVDYVRQLEEQIRVMQSQSNQTSHAPTKEDDVDPFGKSEDYLSDDEVSFLRDIAKSLDDDRQSETISKALEAVSKAEARADQAVQIAKAEREARLNHGFVELAKSYQNIPVDPEDFAPVLKSIYEALDEDQVELLSKVLEAADDSLGYAFDEMGSDLFDEGETFEAVGKAAEEFVSKNDGMTREQAISKMLDSNPALYDDYLAERG